MLLSVIKAVCNRQVWFYLLLSVIKAECYWAIQRSWFARVNALCNISRKKSREVAAHSRADFCVGVASRCV